MILPCCIASLISLSYLSNSATLIAEISFSDQTFSCFAFTLVVLVETISAADCLVGFEFDCFLLEASIPKSFLNKSRAREAKSASSVFPVIHC
jgi:hypothetical protein